MTLQPLIQSLSETFDALDRDPPFQDAIEVRAALELYQGRLKRAAADEDWLATRRNLVAIAATCYRACRDLEIVSEADAVAKDEAHHA